VHAVPAAGATIQPGVFTHHHLALHLHPPSWGFVVALTAIDGVASVFPAAVAKSLIDVQ
jgi:hypothetical protein